MAEPQRSKPESKRGSWIQEAFGRASLAGGRPSILFSDSDKAGTANGQAAPPPGSSVLVGTQQLRGIVRFVGSTNFASGVWVGVELEVPHGRNDGSVKGVRYFECKALHGIFVRPSAVMQEEDGGGAQLNVSASLPVLTSMSSFNDIDDESDYEDKPQAPSQRSSLLDIDEQDWASLGSKLSQHLRSGRRESFRRKRPSDAGSIEDAAGAGPGSEPAGGEAGGAEASKTSSTDLAELVAAQKEGATNELINSTGTPRSTPRRRSSARLAPVETEDIAPPGPSAKPSRPPRTTRQSRSRPVSPNAEAPVMFSKARSTVDLSAAGGPAAIDGDSLSTGGRATPRKRNTIDLTVLRKQAQEEKQLKEKSLPLPSSPIGKQSALEAWRARPPSESNRLQVPESPASPSSSGSPGAVLAVPKPLSPTEQVKSPSRSPRQSPRPSFAQQMQEIVPISASDRADLAEERLEAQHLLAQAVEDHDVEQLRQLLPRATALGVGADELDCAQQMLHFEVQRTLLHEIDDVRACVAVLSEAVQKAEERAVAAERNSELSNERLSLSRGANDRSGKLATQRDEAWVAQVVDRLERRVWEGLEWRVETLRTSVTTATSELLSAVNEIRQLKGSMFNKADLGSSSLPAGFQGTARSTFQGTMLSTDERFDADCEERFAGRSSRESSGPPSQQAAEEERAEELRVLGEALGETAISPRAAKPPLAPTGLPGRVRSRSPAAPGARHKALLEKDAAIHLQKVERGRQARKRVSCLRQLPKNALLHPRHVHTGQAASPSPRTMVREEIRQAAATVIQRGFRRLRSSDSCDSSLQRERPTAPHAGQPALEGRNVQLIKLIAQEGELRLGFKPSGLPPDRIFVESVDPGSWSSAHGLSEGDELIEVGGQGVFTMSTKDFSVEIKKRPLHLTFARDCQPGSPLLVDSRRPSSSNNTETASRRPSSANTGNTGGGDADAANEVTYLAVSGHFGQSDSEPIVNASSDGHRSSWSSAGGGSGQSPRAASPDRGDDVESPLNMNLTLGSSGGALLHTLEAEPDSPLRLTLQRSVDQSPRTRNNPLGVGPRQNVHRSTGNILLALPGSGDREAADGGRRQRSPLEELADSQRGSATPKAASPAGGRSPTARSPMRSPRSPAEFLASLLQGSPNQYSPSSSGTAQSPQKVGVHPASPGSSCAQSPQKAKTKTREPRTLDATEIVQSPQKLRSASTQDTDSPQKALEGLENPQKAKRFEFEALDADQRLGFKPWGLPPDRIYVTEVEDGFWADVNGVAPGDELVACNGQDVANMRPRDLVAAMKARPLNLTFARDPQNGFALPVDSRRLSSKSNTQSSSRRPSASNASNAAAGDAEGANEGVCQADSLSATPPPTDSSLRLSLTPKDDSSSRSLSQLETSAAAPSESPSGIAFVAEKRAWSESPSSPKFAIQSDLGDSMRSRVSLQFPSDCGSPEWPHDSPGNPIIVGSPKGPVSPQPAASQQTSSSGCPAVGEPGWPAAGGESVVGTGTACLSDALFGEKTQAETEIAKPLLQELQPEPPSFEPPGSAPGPDAAPPSFSFGAPYAAAAEAGATAAGAAAAAAAAAATAAAAAAAGAASPEPAEPLGQSLTSCSLPGPEAASVATEEAQPTSLPPQSDKLASEQSNGGAGSTPEEMTTTTDTAAWNWVPEDQEEEEEEEMEHF